MTTSIDFTSSTEWDIVESVHLENSDMDDLASSTTSTSSSSPAQNHAEKVLHDVGLNNQHNFALCLEGILNSLDQKEGFDLICSSVRSAEQGTTISGKVVGFGSSVAGGATILATETAVYVPAYFFSGVVGGAMLGSQIVDNRTYNTYGSIALIPQLAGGVAGAIVGGISGAVTGIFASVSSGVYDVVTYATDGKLKSNEVDDSEIVPYREIAHELLEGLGFEVDGKE
eukprot:TRINITY_DN933_c0_g1_i4.p2 TRINITY_DN933_c0_g1~~TRINITY_DN933_c0_g1_i4.p2  ORF type:complete len:228 (+),score=68.67 TRINITY_DN933_c0_g1_i4:946-1629(+)